MGPNQLLPSLPVRPRVKYITESLSFSTCRMDLLMPLFLSISVEPLSPMPTPTSMQTWPWSPAYPPHPLLPCNPFPTQKPSPHFPPQTF